MRAVSAIWLGFASLATDDLLVDAVTQGERPLYGNFPDGSRYPRT
ncbi:MAG: hypothetical protein NTU52_04655 [Actinobacteria bacterium]|nr:hypothetical protein [Actinomycetota bacterium]